MDSGQEEEQVQDLEQVEVPVEGQVQVQEVVQGEVQDSVEVLVWVLEREQGMEEEQMGKEQDSVQEPSRVRKKTGLPVKIKEETKAP
jgi:hypothetical protein